MPNLDSAACVIWLLIMEEAIEPLPQGPKPSSFQRMADMHLRTARKYLDRGSPAKPNLECAYYYLAQLVPELPNFYND